MPSYNRRGKGQRKRYGQRKQGRALYKLCCMHKCFCSQQGIWSSQRGRRSVPRSCHAKQLSRQSHGTSSSRRGPRKINLHARQLQRTLRSRQNRRPNTVDQRTGDFRGLGKNGQKEAIRHSHRPCSEAKNKGRQRKDQEEEGECKEAYCKPTQTQYEGCPLCRQLEGGCENDPRRLETQGGTRYLDQKTHRTPETQRGAHCFTWTN
mmetsp:Transcript_36213/g.57947  ORF Transcript_36213/g.57947 Transcript_36213/m.57947 type:complete len:206 (-) Transcript_36213:2048-2665(-)